jgi:hypothetical protein
MEIVKSFLLQLNLVFLYLYSVFIDFSCSNILENFIFIDIRFLLKIIMSRWPSIYVKVYMY